MLLQVYLIEFAQAKTSYLLKDIVVAIHENATGRWEGGTSEMRHKSLEYSPSNLSGLDKAGHLTWRPKSITVL